MATIHVDGKQYEVSGGDNLLSACMSLGLDIPYFCWHPALGQLVRSKLYADLISRFVSPGERVTVFCHPARLSDVVGVKQSNLLSQAARGVQMQVVEDISLMKDELKVKNEYSYDIYSIIKDSNYSIHEV